MSPLVRRGIACCAFGAAGLFALVAGCKDKTSPAADSRPNVVWIVWDTVRADHMGLYDHTPDTTPKLNEWAKQARVYTDVVSPAPYTVASHASMFTGLLPSEHGAGALNEYLDGSLTTIAERLRDAGYQTYLYSANPHISARENFTQGFSVVEHPWSPHLREQALRIVRSKLRADDRSSELTEKLRQPTPHLRTWDIKACGELTQERLLHWLGEQDRSKPFFAFLNYMEAHRPYIPPEKYRRQVMSPAFVARSYTIDRSWDPMWSYTFGLHEYSDEDLAVMAATYDACIAELDDLFAHLIASLQAGGYLDNTIVILTSDHGEHLGEHHLLDHQYSVYEPLLRVPLIVWYPKRFAPGHDDRPVMTFDLFPTLIELAGISDDVNTTSRAISLLAARTERNRLGENPGAPRGPMQSVQRLYPQWDPTPWMRTLRALYVGEYKYIRGSDGSEALYDLATDPQETQDVATQAPRTLEAMRVALEQYVGSLHPVVGAPASAPALSPDDREMLEALGYLQPSSDAATKPASAPAAPAADR